MSQTPPEVAIAAISSIAFWLSAVLVILIAGQFFAAIRGFRKKMTAKWNPALVIASLFVVGMGFGGQGFLNPSALAVFCQALIGLAIASSIEGWQPLPLISAFVQHRQPLRQVIFMAALSVAAAAAALLIGTVGLSIGHQLFGETNYTSQAANALSPNKWLAFFLFFSGSGIGEETPFRLVLLSFIWKVSRRKWLAIVLSALIFGAYHLTPLNSMYRIFWQFPISQFIAGTLIGLVWGYLFTRRGYETTVLGHTLSNWLPLVFFAS
jgi:membrane protease YdiL (CAAX protease family)